MNVMESIWNETTLFYEPRKYCKEKYGWPESVPQMSEFESAFLCGLIREKKPRKIVELGVAAGGTTAVVLKCLDMLGLDSQTEMISMDIREMFHGNNGKKSGYEAYEILNEDDHHFHHKFILGKYLPEVIDDVEGADFVILDTVHQLPGEFLDFLAIFPYLIPNACVVLHDTRLHLSKLVNQFATQTLLSCVVADKIVQKDVTCPMLYPNIAAFTINENTRENLCNVFLGLLIPWEYIIGEHEFAIYYDNYLKNYGEEYAGMFTIAYELQKKAVRLKKEDEIKLLNKSRAYRLGSAFLWFPKKIRRIFKKL